jgi:hypothetical protein
MPMMIGADPVLVGPVVAEVGGRSHWSRARHPGDPDGTSPAARNRW